jgi:hypothetical protein
MCMGMLRFGRNVRVFGLKLVGFYLLVVVTTMAVLGTLGLCAWICSFVLEICDWMLVSLRCFVVLFVVMFIVALVRGMTGLGKRASREQLLGETKKGRVARPSREALLRSFEWGWSSMYAEFMTSITVQKDEQGSIGSLGVG